VDELEPLGEEDFDVSAGDEPVEETFEVSARSFLAAALYSLLRWSVI